MGRRGQSVRQGSLSGSPRAGVAEPRLNFDEVSSWPIDFQMDPHEYRRFCVLVVQ